MKIRNLIPATTRVVVIPPGAQAGSNTTATLIDMQDCESIMLILAYPTGLSAANTPVLSATHGDKSDGSDQAAVPNTQTAALAAAVSQQSLELVRPTKRYIRPIVTCNGANEYYTVIAIQTLKQLPGGPESQWDGVYGDAPQEGFGRLPLVAQNATFNTTTGAFAGGGYLQTPVAAGLELATLLPNP